MRLIFIVCSRRPFHSSAEFCEAHPELMKKDALMLYYSRDRLFSQAAKTAFVEPDLQPLPEK
jgi:hypothetical protein